MGVGKVRQSVHSLSNPKEMAVFDKVMSQNRVEGKSLSLEKAHTDGATVSCRAMYVEMSVAKTW